MVSLITRPKSISAKRQIGFLGRLARRFCDSRLERAKYEVNRYG